MTTVKAVILDLDGTLLDHVGSATAALHAWLGRQDDAFVRRWFEIEEVHHHRWITGEVSFQEQRRGRLRDVLPILGRMVPDDAGLDELFAGYLEAYEASWVGFDDIAKGFDAIGDRPVAILTNGAQAQQEKKVAALGLTDRVAGVFTAEGLGYPKPRPESYLSVCRALGFDPEEVLHVGDRHDLDVLAPRALGLRAVHLDRLDDGPHDEPERITSLADLVP